MPKEETNVVPEIAENAAREALSKPETDDKTPDADVTADRQTTHGDGDEKRFTQEEVNRIVQERLRRAEKVQAKAPENEQDTKAELAALKRDMTNFKAENHALRCGVPEKNLVYVTKLAQTLDADSIEAAIDQVLKDMPFLGQEPPDTTSPKQVLQASVKKTGAPKVRLTKKEIAAIRDPAERRKAIKENISLYQ